MQYNPEGSVSLGQESAFIEGVILTAQGTPIEPPLYSPAKVVIKGKALNKPIEVTTGSNGHFISPPLPANGTYDVIVSAPNYVKVTRRSINLPPGSKAHLIFNMKYNGPNIVFY
jgi:hypothetical protein